MAEIEWKSFSLEDQYSSIMGRKLGSLPMAFTYLNGLLILVVPGMSLTLHLIWSEQPPVSKTE